MLEAKSKEMFLHNNNFQLPCNLNNSGIFGEQNTFRRFNTTSMDNYLNAAGSLSGNNMEYWMNQFKNYTSTSQYLALLYLQQNNNAFFKTVPQPNKGTMQNSMIYQNWCKEM